jgi:hypothetical protein
MLHSISVIRGLKQSSLLTVLRKSRIARELPNWPVGDCRTDCVAEKSSLQFQRNVAWGIAMLRFARLRAGRLALLSVIAAACRHGARRGLTILICSASFWGIVSGIVVGVVSDARQPASAQEKQVGPYMPGTKEDRARIRKIAVNFAKSYYKKGHELLEKLSGKPCDSKQDAQKVAELQKEWDEANEGLNVAMDNIISHSEDLTEDERSALASMTTAKEELEHTAGPARAEKQAAYDKVRQHFREITSERREKIRTELAEGKEDISYTADCPTYAVLPPNGPITVSVNVDYADLTSTTKFKTATDTETIRGDPSLLQLSGKATLGPWFVKGQIEFGNANSGSLADVFPAFPAANFSGSINSGTLYDVIADAGYDFLRGPDYRVGAFGGYYSLNPSLYGTIAGGAAVGPILIDHWQAARVGVDFEETFFAGDRRVVLSANVAGLPFVAIHSGAFYGTGGGVQGEVRLSFPLPNVPLRGDVFVQDTYMTASGSVVGGSMRADNSNWVIGGGLTYSFGATNPPPAMPILTK